MQQNGSTARVLDFGQSDPLQNNARLFDRYRARGVAALAGGRPFDQLLETDWFPPMLLWALPDFYGDGTNAVAMLDESALAAAISDTEGITAAELHAEFPVMQSLAERLGLSFEEMLLLAFLAQAQGDLFWEDWVKRLGPGTRRQNARHLAKVLGLNPETVYGALNPGSPLRASSLLDWKFNVRIARVFDQFALCSDFDVEMLRTSDAWDEFFRTRFDVLAYATEGFDFSHLQEDMQLVQSSLEGALNANVQGTHVLLYGPSGAGKTTLARDLARRLQCELLEVRMGIATGAESDGLERLKYFNLGQRLGNGDNRRLVLFDELEDLLPGASLGGRHDNPHKGWICQSLERTKIPTIWTSNSIRSIDPAILRRFGLTLEVGVPPISFRRRLLKESLVSAGVTECWCDRIAQVDCLTPAMTAQMRDVATSLAADADELEAALEHWLRSRLQAMGRAFRIPAQRQAFRCDLLNLDTSPDDLIRGLNRSREGRLCFHGPPGTGKTAFAHYLAERLDRPALVRRGSDLRRAYVGETERNVADMFRRASRDEAVLILDEADGFLSNRSARFQRWEMNEASEFLVQLENFNGIFCATTNRFADLDPAFMRRFDLKIRFNYLDTSQRERLLKAVLQESGEGTHLEQTTCDRLALLEELSPGDFVVARRKLRLSDQKVNQATLLSALVHEVGSKNVYKRPPIGFRWEA